MSIRKSIRKEIRNLAVISVITVLLFTFIINTVYKFVQEREEILNEFNTLAEITALNSQSALLFNDQKISLETLTALSPRAEVLKAEIINNAGELLASKTFERHGINETFSREVGEYISQIFGAFFGLKSTLQITQPVQLNNQALGKVSLSIDTSLIWNEIFLALATDLGAMIMAILLAVPLIRRTSKHIMLPISRLSESASQAALNGQYSDRVEKMEDDELGTLTDQFNHMLDEVQKRDKSLITKNDLLEIEVQKRTETLKKAMDELSESEFRWKFAIEGSGDGVWDTNEVDQTISYSQAWKAIIGYSKDDVINTLDEWERRIHLKDKAATLASVQDCLDGKISIYVSEYRILCEDGKYKWVFDRGVVVNRSEDGKPLRMIGTTSDITARKLAENDLRIAATAFESQEGMLITDANNRILRVNQAFTKITGYSAEEIVGENPSMLSSGRQDEVFYSAMWESIHQTGAWAGEIWNKRKNGEVYPEYLTITAVKDPHEIITNYVATLTDITERKLAEDEIEHLAFYDPLTHLPNRRLLVDRLNQALASSARSGRDGALLFLDLDHFKTLNDTLGHDIGDLLLQQVGTRLTNAVREGDTVARLGGDEYVIMLENLSESALEAATQTEAIGEKIITALNQPYQLVTHEYNCTPSIGIALFSGHEQSYEELLKHADIAMYQAKKAGRNTLRFFDPKMQQAIHARVDLEHELHKAIEQKQFHLYYQIQVDDSGCAMGAEALIRWIHPERGLVPPFHFIPLAEETGLILPIGSWVLETACIQLKAWEQDLTTRDLTISINVSAKQFNQVDFVSQVQTAVQHYAINPARLKLELTESMLVENIESIIMTMVALQSIGVRFELDDFGTGYSSLQYLKKLPLYQLKIDQSFVRDIGIDSSDKALVHTIITMAQSLALKAIAEGVETQDQRQILLDIGCKYFQGYLFGKPVPVGEFEASLRKKQ